MSSINGHARARAQPLALFTHGFVFVYQRSMLRRFCGNTGAADHVIYIVGSWIAAR